MWAFDDELSDDFELFTEDQVGAEDAEPAATTAADNVDGAGSRDFDESTRFDFDGDDEDAASALRAPSSSQSTRRRGRRGSGHGSSEKQKKWRSGHIPPPPQFSGDLEADPYCWRHYARSLRRWCLITSEYLPRSEQALRALDALVGEAAQEVEEIPDTRYFREDGIDVLLKDLEAAFGEREVYRRGGLIREFESLTRLQGESVDAFVRRYKLYERKLKDAKIPTYPSETRAVKLLDGLRLSEQATAHLLLAAGNKYDMDAILNAIKVQYPAGLTPTGLARHPATVVGPTRSRGRGSHGRGRGKSGGSFKWRTWQTEVQPDDEPAAEPAYGIYETVEDDPALTFEDPIDEQFEYQYDDYEYEEEPDEQVPEEVPADFEGDKEETAQALTATSKRLAAATQARGYYTSALKGKGKGVGKTKDKGDGKKGSTTSSSSTSKGKGQGGKSGKGAPKGASKGGKGKTSTQRHRLQSSLCLGCGASDHWLRECPHMTQHQAHVCSTATTLDGEGAIVWVTSHNKIPPPPPSDSPPSVSSPRSMSSSEWKDAWDPSAHPPSGCNPDDFMEAEDEWSMWQMEAHRANELLERQMPQSAAPSAAPSFHTLGPESSGWRTCQLAGPSSSQGDVNPDDYEEFLDDMHFLRLEAEGCLAELSRNQEEINNRERTSEPQDFNNRERTSEPQEALSPGEQTPGLQDPRSPRFRRMQKYRHQLREERERTRGPQEASSDSQHAHTPPTLAGAPYLAQRAPVVDPPVICLFREVTSHDDLSMLPKKTYHTDPVRLMRHRSGAASTTALLRTGCSYSSLVTTCLDTTSPTRQSSSMACSNAAGGTPSEETEGPRSFRIPSMTTFVQYSDEPCLVIVDAGCQRQVAGQRWHAAHHEHLGAPRLAFSEKCQFRFGPHKGSSSFTRFAYPAGLGGQFSVLFFPCVEDDAPALMSRNTLAVLDGLVDICRGEMVYRALQTTSPLYLSSCGHLAVRVDEWPEDMPQWPCVMPVDDMENLPDVWAPAAKPVQARTLPSARFPANTPWFPDAQTAASAMAPTMEEDAHECLQLYEDGGHERDPLCSRQPGSKPTRPDLAPDDTVHSGDYDEYHGIKCSASLLPAHHLPQEGGDMHPRPRTTCLRGRRPVSSHLRSVRFSSCSPQRSNGARRSKSQSTCEDTTPTSRASGQGLKGQEQGSKQGLRKAWFLRTVAFWLGTFLTFLAGLLLGSVPDFELTDSQAGGGAGSEALRAFGPEGSGSSTPDLGDGQCLEPELGSDWWRPLVESSSLGSRPQPTGGRRLRLELGGSGRGDRASRAELRADELGRVQPMIYGSADQPLTYEDRGLHWLKPGKQKRLLGTVRQMKQLWMVELSIYDGVVQRGRWLRRCKADLIEVYAGHGNITEYAIEKGLRVMQPVDKVFGVELNTKKDFIWLNESLNKWKPILTILEPECRLWSPLTNLNYYWRPEELARLRQEAQVTVSGVVCIIESILADGRLFLLENPHHGKLWEQPDMVKLMNSYELHYDYGNMCMYELRGKAGNLLNKPTGWLSNCKNLLQGLNKKCDGRHQHEECMGPNTKLAAVYTKQLAKSVIDQFVTVLHGAGDERFALSTSWPVPSTSYPTASSSRAPRTPSRAPSTPAPGTPGPAPGTPGRLPTVLEDDEQYADVSRDMESWQPLLKEAAERLEGKVALSAEIKPGAFLEQLKSLVPWHVAFAQIYKTPKTRRMPVRRMFDVPISHRAAILLFADGTITIESENMAHVTNPNSRFEKNVRVGIFVYGQPFSLTAAQRKTRAAPTPTLPEPEEVAKEDWRIPDITFPGISEDQVPKWMQGVLRRLHSNLGHPAQNVMVRMLAQANATPAALIGARALRCGVCDRARPPREPRPAKVADAKRFNQRLMLDLIFCKDATGQTFTFLNQLDDATTYQALTLLENRESSTINKVLVQGWFQYFGLPESLLIDAEGALKSFSFEELMSQSNVAVRYVPPDAHYQLGKCERHGAIARAILRKLIDEHGLIGPEAMSTGAVLSCHAKNTMMRRAGCAPAQWVFGQLPRLPASVLSEAENAEAMEKVSLSSKLQQVELLRYAAMHAFLSFDNDDQLRRSILRKSRPWRGPFEVGMKIVYYRLRNNLDNEGSQPGYRQGIIVGIDPGVNGSLWIRNDRGRLVQVAREQARTLVGQELWIPDHQDFALLRSAEQDLAKKHATAHDLRDAPLPPELPDVPLPAGPQRDEERPETPDEPHAKRAALERPPSAIPSVVMDAPLDASGQPLGDEPTSASTMARPLVLEPQRETSIASRRASTATEASLPEVKRPKLSSAASARSSGSEVPELPSGFSRQSSVQARQISQGTEVLPPVPEDDDLMADPIPPDARDDPPSEMLLEPASVSLTNHFAYTISAKSFCQFCGCLEKQMCAGQPQCCRCLSFEFTDHPEHVTSWFDEDVEYDARTRSWRNSQLAQADDLHLPQQEELDVAWTTGIWQNNEVLRVDTTGTTTSKINSSLKSVAAWSNPESRWSWLTVANVSTDVEPETIDLNKKVVIYHSTTQGRKKLSNELLRQQRFLYGPHQPRSVWLLRHGREDAVKNGWDGGPKEIQSLAEGQQHFLLASLYEDWREAQASATLQPQTEETFQAYMLSQSGDDFIIPSTSDEEEGGLKRTQRQALKRELPWRSIAKADWGAFCESIVKEWDEWKKWSSCTKFAGDPNTIPRHLILTSRVCYRWKPIDGGASYKAKARIVIQGFRDPHLPLLSRDAPVLSRTGLMCILQWAASNKTDLVNGDCKSAFLQGKPDDERPEKIYMKVPQDGISLYAIKEWTNAPDTLYQLTAPVYGAANAPRRWYLHVRETMEGLGWQVHSLDPCLFLKHEDAKVIAVLGIHVDDILASALQPEVLKAVEASFTWGGNWEVNDFVFIGRRIIKHDDTLHHPFSEPLCRRGHCEPHQG